jgi:hypothetical protein
MPPADPLEDILELGRTAARNGVAEARQTQPTTRPNPIAPLLDKRAHALGVSTATDARLCRQRRIPFVPVGEVRRFDLDAVRAALVARRDEAGVRGNRNARDQARGSPSLREVRPAYEILPSLLVQSSFSPAARHGVRGARPTKLLAPAARCSRLTTAATRRGVRRKRRKPHAGGEHIRASVP